MSQTTTSVAPPPSPAAAGQRSRALSFFLFLVALLWFLYVRGLSTAAATALDLRFDLGSALPLVQASLLLVLVVCGLSILRSIERRREPLCLSLGLPRRATSGAEWATGAAIGWGIAVATILPLALARALDLRLWTTPRAFTLFFLSLLTLAVASLAHALAIYGYGFQRLIDATSPVRATFILVGLSAIHTAYLSAPDGTANGTRILIAVLASILLCLCWMRTHGLWMLWGLHFAWTASTAVLFGLPLAGDNTFSSVIDTRAIGPTWLTGGDYGPAAAALTLLLLFAAIPVLIRVTDDYAWNYTRPPLVPGGYDVTIAPPTAHSAMEQSGQPDSSEPQPVHPAKLVQILPAAPLSSHTPPE
ncbi:MAG: CPBP family intramembrane metalloprotease [Acidobacteriaceae bacterium]|nr:CPBP family intramembrane metalloprotease [Acidobacteriaceae bacterium]